VRSDLSKIERTAMNDGPPDALEPVFRRSPYKEAVERRLIAGYLWHGVPLVADEYARITGNQINEK